MVRIVTLVLFFIGLINNIVAQNTPYRVDSTYKLELGMEYKKVPVTSTTTFVPGQTSTIVNKGYDFYLIIKLNLLVLQSDDHRIRISNNYGKIVVSKRLKKPDQFVIDIGRSSEIKNGIAPNEYKIQFIGDDKSTKSIITLEFTETGAFNVNEVQFGQI